MGITFGNPTWQLVWTGSLGNLSSDTHPEAQIYSELSLLSEKLLTIANSDTFLLRESYPKSLETWKIRAEEA